MGRVCKNCGCQISNDEMSFCVNCGSKLDSVVTFNTNNDTNNVNNANMNTNANINNMSSVNNANMSFTNKTYNESLLAVAKIFMILSCVSCAAFIIPLFWLIPMTIKIFNREKTNEKFSIGFKICTLLFGNMVSGIVLLVDENI